MNVLMGRRRRREVFNGELMKLLAMDTTNVLKECFKLHLQNVSNTPSICNYAWWERMRVVDIAHGKK